MIQSMSVENEQAGLPKLPHETIFSAANRVIFPVQLTTSRIGNLAYPVDPYSNRVIFPVQLTTSRIGNLAYPVDPYSTVPQHLPILYRHGESREKSTAVQGQSVGMETCVRPWASFAPVFYIYIYIYLFFQISLIADGPHHYHPACGH